MDLPRGFRRGSLKQTCLSSPLLAGGGQTKSAVRRSIQNLILTRLSGLLEALPERLARIQIPEFNHLNERQ